MAFSNRKGDGQCGGTDNTARVEISQILPLVLFCPQSLSLLSDLLQHIDLIYISSLQVYPNLLIHLFSYLLSIFTRIFHRHFKLTLSTQKL